MKIEPATPVAPPATLRDVIDRLAGDDIRRRDLRSAITSYAKLVGLPPSDIPLDLAAIRRTLDGMSPAQAGRSAKRWSNLRSDLSAAIDASGLVPILRTKHVVLDAAWKTLLDPIKEERIRLGLSRFARWATLRRIAPDEVCGAIIDAFIAEMEDSTLVRNVSDQRRSVANAWNRLAGWSESRRLVPVHLPSNAAAPTRFPWEDLPTSFQDEGARYFTWASVPDPLDEGARAKALAPSTLGLRRDQIHSAVTAAVAAGIVPESLSSLATLVAPETFKAVLRHRWKQDGDKLSAYTHGVAGALIAIAAEWVKASNDEIATLKALRRKLGTLPSGLTDKNKALLRKFDDPRLLEALVNLPDKLWRKAVRDLATSRRSFIDLQSAIAIDLLLHTGLRMENLSALSFDSHLHWPQGRGKPALLVIAGDETKNDAPFEAEIPAYLADRLWTYRNEISPKVTGKRPRVVFVTWQGTPRGQSTLALAIAKTVRKHLGIEMTPHQFRHLIAKITLDANPGAIEQVRQHLGHKNSKTTTNFYAGTDTRRAGRAHGALLMTLREGSLGGRTSRKRAKRGKG